MNTKRLILLCLLFVGFSVLSGFAAFEHGYIGIWKAGFTNMATIQILTDLCIGCFIISAWMIGDARSRNKQIWFWILLIILLGTLPILLYLILRELEKKESKSV